ncbi:MULTISPECIES: MDR family MFS transporter [Paenibacillus]|uniref:MDR family MFS transporter n=1 Tax=Paenibacillus TaxID=44249 RepID=UPI00020D7772|nr:MULTISPECIES: MDR family MFS transporter [Paenibacillus]EGL16804.1 drug resistance MFS transporter, drug:H+ antiporter-2 family [Paenibacillus sp. HGF7]EPD82423.1 drug:H+ antiporter-2 (14 Spanner) (DHA2) family drug resistance MFS transporter [Paenibacillus sp. HGH0039]MBV6714359.1 MFS transporter [Paenibacillus chitinolyticus]
MARSGNTDKTKVLLAIMVVTFLSSIEGTIVSTAIPRIVGDLGGLDLMSWVISIYLLTTAVSTPIFGKLSDLYGRKKIFMIGTGLFLIGSTLCGIAQSMEMMIFFRAVQGIGAGAILPVTMIIVGDIYSFEERAKIQGWISGIWGLSGILGPLAGGLMVDYVSWRWIFYFNIPFGIISMLLISAYLHENLEKTKRPIDYPGIVTFTVSMTALIYALLSGGVQYAWGSPVILGLLVVSVVFLFIFIAVEKRSPEPMLPLDLFKDRLLTLINSSGFILSAILVAVTIYLPLWVQSVNGGGATGSGFALIPLSICWTVGAALAGRGFVRLGVRSAVLIGVGGITAGSVALALMTSATPGWALEVYTALFGIGFGFAFTAYTITMQSAVGWKLRGAAMSSHTFIRTLGQTLGIAVFGMLYNTSLHTYQQAHPDQVGGIDLNKALDAHGRSAFSPETMAGIRELFAFSLSRIFWSLLVLAAIGIVLTLLLPKRFKVEEEPELAAEPEPSRQS